MTFTHLKTLPAERLHALTGLRPAVLAELLAVALPVLTPLRRDALQQRRPRQRAMGAGAKRLLSPVREVLLVLIYLRHNVAHEVVGQLFGVSADTSGNLFHEIVPCCGNSARPSGLTPTCGGNGASRRGRRRRWSGC